MRSDTLPGEPDLVVAVVPPLTGGLHCGDITSALDRNCSASSRPWRVSRVRTVLRGFELGHEAREVMGDEDMERGRGRPVDGGPHVRLMVALDLPLLAVGVQ